MSLRISDSNAEKQVSIFLDENFYAKYYPSYKRISIKEEQLRGIDTIIDFEKYGEAYCDEKAAVHYVNQNLKTFAFELDFKLPTGEVVDGWFISQEKVTQVYLLSWLWAQKDKDFNASEITRLEVVLISRKRINQELVKFGITTSDLIAKVKNIRLKNVSGVIEKSDEKPFYFYLTKHLTEEPVNLIINKSFLIKHSMCHKIINKS